VLEEFKKAVALDPQDVRQVRGGEPRVVDEMEEGSIFGEIALLAEVPRVASVIASEESLLLEVSRELLDEMSMRHKSLPALLQRFYKERLLANLLRSSELFRAFSREALARLAQKFELKTAEGGDELVGRATTGAACSCSCAGAASRTTCRRERSIPSCRKAPCWGRSRCRGR
jgi:CRP-like cAMP-binding protein